ncbi:indole-3-glycerol phosphate synthase TrpC [Bacillus alveayuensis]|jgi:indole-3-glycerol phosphate synthase|uniref:indole-3-glycerol phosphate synthase TrpC n=1 Tax=Aeribacillus alveayuensis TaxID=279215 RepID=UPI0005CD3FC9|nr:indole-3-glycerol phosphate synthase TrpC [Bacillus alveayuensis]
MLKQILETKRQEVETLVLPPKSDVKRISLLNALKHSKRKPALIAEVKKASPSKGVIRENFEPVAIAKTYEKAGAAAISVLTDQQYFQGHRDYLTEIKQAVQVPILRKDFIIERKQIEESLRIGADAVLLIGEALEVKKLYELYEEAYENGLECLVEVHEQDTLERILAVFTPKIIGVNNRNLKTFVTSLDTTKEIVSFIPKESLFVSESGISSYKDIQTVKAYGADAVLVGESLMRKENILLAVRELFGEVNGFVDTP